MIGVSHRKKRRSRIFLKNSFVRLILYLLLVMFLQAESRASMIEPFPQWTVGSSWAVKAVYKQLNGDWSKAKTWIFTVDGEDEGSFHIRVRGEDSSQALLSFDKKTGQLQHIMMTDVLRGEELIREVRIETISPVYPSVSAIPFHFPCFSYDASNAEYRLKRSLNGRPIGLELLGQSVEPVDRNRLLSDLSMEAKKDLETFSFESEGFLFVIEKKERLIFKQYWFPEFPWAVYTETQDCKAWLKK